MPRNPEGLVLSNWHRLFEDFHTSTQEFYAAVEEGVRRRGLPGVSVSRERFSEGGIGSPDREYLRIRRDRTAFDICSAPYGDGHFFSWWLARIPPRFGVTASITIFVMAMFTTLILHLMLSSIFPDSLAGIIVKVLLPLFLYPLVLLVMGSLVQQGLFADEDVVMLLPVIGRLYVFAFNPVTYYRLDTAMMFRDSVRSAVNEVINGLREERGLRLLGDEDLRPDTDDEAATA